MIHAFCAIDAEFIALHRRAIEALIPVPPESGVVLLDDGRVTAVAGLAATPDALTVTSIAGNDQGLLLLGGEIRHRAALLGAPVVKAPVSMAPRLGFHTETISAQRVERVIAIHQPNYLPWCGYFAKLTAANVFVFLDDVPMPGGSSYVNRTRVGGNAASQWLSVPTRHSLDEPLHRATVAVRNFGKKHVGTLRARYGRTTHFKLLMQQLEPIYLSADERLVDFNIRCIDVVRNVLGLDRAMVHSSALPTSSTAGDRLVELVKRLGGTRYLSGRGGDNYQSESAFRAAGIALDVRAYTPLPYTQTSSTFEPGLSIIDALAHVGPEATRALLVLP